MNEPVTASEHVAMVLAELGLNELGLPPPGGLDSSAPKGCLVRSQADEPVFVLCARDENAAAIVDKWAERAFTNGAPVEKCDDAHAVADKMRAWGKEHGTRTPGTSR